MQWIVLCYVTALTINVSTYCPGVQRHPFLYDWEYYILNKKFNHRGH